MSLKPPKKSDLDKSWMKARRDKPKKIQPEYHLIITEETTYHAIWSNQCIELWFLLHFSFMQSDLHRSSYWPKLTEILSAQGLGPYEKNRADMYQILFPYMNAAIANAEKLDKINDGKLPSASAPGTKVHVLVKKLKPYLIEVT